jgi:hypothetical protein
MRMAANDPGQDPFGEQSSGERRVRHTLLGARFVFRSTTHRLLRLVESAYGGLAASARRGAPTFDLELRLAPGRKLRRTRPGTLRPFAGSSGLLGGIMDADNFVLLSPATGSGLISVSPQMLRHPYQVRYELIEFAVFTLASRARQLLSLHAGCVAQAGRALLLMGSTGTGKSTLALHCALQGLDFLSEDATFVDAGRLQAYGVPNFAYARPSAIALIGNARAADRVRRAPLIRRRSGVAKREVDLRRLGCRLCSAPVPLAGIVFLGQPLASGEARLRALSPRQTQRRFEALQAYATRLPRWPAFRRRLKSLPGFELQRGSHPDQSVVALTHLLRNLPRPPGPRGNGRRAARR